MARVAVARDKYAKGFQPGQEQVPEVYEVLELRKALHRVYPKDAHLVAYLVEGATLQPRVNKPGLALFGKRLTVEVFFCDLDNPNHDPWTPESFEAARLQDQTLPSLSTAGVYYTRRGRRAVQPLLTPLEVPDVERHLEAWLSRLEQDGLAVDWSCTDWTRHFRLPNVGREPGGRSRCIDLSRMVPIALPELPPLPPPDSDASGRPARTRRPRGPVGPHHLDHHAARALAAPGGAAGAGRPGGHHRVARAVPGAGGGDAGARGPAGACAGALPRHLAGDRLRRPRR